MSLLRPTLLLALGLALVAGPAVLPTPAEAAPAQKKTRKTGANTVQYRWVDEKGHTHFSDTLPQEALRQGRTVYRNGRVVDHVERVPTPEEAEAIKQAEREAAQREQAQAEQAREQAKAREIYGSVEAVEAEFATKRSVAEGKIRGLETSIQQTRQVLVERLDSAANLELNDKPIPKVQVADIQKLAGQIREYREQIAQEQALLEDLAAQQARLVEMISPAAEAVENGQPPVPTPTP